MHRRNYVGGSLDGASLCRFSSVSRNRLSADLATRLLTIAGSPATLSSMALAPSGPASESNTVGASDASSRSAFREHLPTNRAQSALKYLRHASAARRAPDGPAGAPPGWPSNALTAASSARTSAPLKQR